MVMHKTWDKLAELLQDLTTANGTNAVKETTHGCSGLQYLNYITITTNKCDEL